MGVLRGGTVGQLLATPQASRVRKAVMMEASLRCSRPSVSCSAAAQAVTLALPIRCNVDSVESADLTKSLRTPVTYLSSTSYPKVVHRRPFLANSCARMTLLKAMRKVQHGNPSRELKSNDPGGHLERGRCKPYDGR